MAEAILGIALLILLAKIFEEIATRLKQPPLVGDVLAGLLLGPAVFSAVEPKAEIELFITIGVFFFFFLIGIEEIDLAAFVATARTRLFVAALLAFAIPFGLAYGVSLALDRPAIQALAIASLVAISSLSVLAKVLSDIGRLKDHTGLQLFTATVIIELLGLLIISVAIEAGASAEGFGGAKFGLQLVRIAGFVVVATLVGHFLIPPALRLIVKYTKAKEIPFGVLMGVLLLFVYFGDRSGLHGTIGALILGVALSKTVHEFYFDIVRGFRNLAYGVFVPIFFAGVGLRLDFSFFELSAVTILAFIGVTIAGKYLGGLLGAGIMKLEAPAASAFGLMAKGSLEVALLLSLIQLEIFDKQYFSLFTFIVLVFMLAMPTIINKTFARATHFEAPREADLLIPTYAQATLSEVRVRNVMTPLRFAISQNLTIADFVSRHLVLGGTHYIVTGAKGNLEGLVAADSVHLVPQAYWSTMRVKRIMDTHVVTAYLDDSVYSVVEKMVQHNVPVIPVEEPFSDGKIVGIVTRSEILESLVGKPGEKEHPAAVED